VSPAALRADWDAAPGRADVMVILEPSAGQAAELRPMSQGEAAVYVAASVVGARQGGRWPSVVDAVLEALDGAEARRAGGSPARELAQRLERECTA
jgi:hypothetical protein